MVNIRRYIGKLRGTFPGSNLKYYIFALAVVLGFIVPLFAFVISVVFSYKILIKLLNPKIFDSKFFVFAISIFFYVLILQAVVLTSWLFSNNFPLSLCGPLSLPVLIAIYHSIKLRDNKGSTRQWRAVTTKDMMSIIVCMATLVLVVVLPIHHSGNNTPSGLMVLINQSFDDSSHIGLLNDRLQFNRGVILNSDAEGHTRSKGVLFYPPGWHSANAVIIKSFYPNISTGYESVIAYIITKVFWFLFLVYIFVRTAFSLYGVFTKKRQTVAVTIWLTGGSLLFTGWFLKDSFEYGFYSFLPQLIIIPIFILSLIQIALLKWRGRDEMLRSLPLPLALCVGSALSWLLLFPVFVAALFLSICDLLLKWGFLKTIRRLVRQVPRYLFFFILIFMSIVAQMVILINSNQSISFIDGILMNGPAQIYPTTFYGFMFVGLLLFIVLAIRNNNTTQLKPILYYILTIVSFSALLYILQLYITQTNSYYYFKSLSAFTIVGAIGCTVGFALSLSWIERKMSHITSVVIALIFLLTSLQFVYTRPANFSYIKGERTLSNATNKEIFKLFKNSYTQANYYNKEVTIYYPADNNPTLNEVASTILSSNKPYNMCYSSTKTASFTTPPSDFSILPILKYCKNYGYKITYYINQESFSSMQKTINEARLGNWVKLKLIK